MNIQIALVLLAAAVLAYTAFVGKDRWRQTFFTLILTEIVARNAGAPVEVSYVLVAAAVIFFAVWLWQSHRHSNSDPDADAIGRRLAAKAKLADAKASGDYSSLSDRDVRDAGLPVLELPDATVQMFPNSVHIVVVDKDGTPGLLSVMGRSAEVLQLFEKAGIRTEQVVP